VYLKIFLFNKLKPELPGSFPYRNTRKMSLCLQAAFGVHPVMSSIKLWKTVFCLSWALEIGWSLIIWVLVP